MHQSQPRVHLAVLEGKVRLGDRGVDERVHLRAAGTVPSIRSIDNEQIDEGVGRSCGRTGGLESELSDPARDRRQTRAMLHGARRKLTAGRFDDALPPIAGMLNLEHAPTGNGTPNQQPLPRKGPVSRSYQDDFPSALYKPPVPVATTRGGQRRPAIPHG